MQFASTKVQRIPTQQSSPECKSFEMSSEEKMDGSPRPCIEKPFSGTPKIVADLSLVSLGSSNSSECFNSCSAVSLFSEERNESPIDRPMSPQTGFTLRISREQGQLSECALSSVPTVVQSERRILAPRLSHGSPFRPMRLFSPIVNETDNEHIKMSPQSNAFDSGNARRVHPRVMPRHLRQLKRDEMDHEDQIQQNLAAEPEICAQTCTESKLLSNDILNGIRSPRDCSLRPSFRHDFFNFVPIGKGTYGNVFRCVRKLDLRSYALKEIASPLRSKGERERALKEIYALATQADNVHVVRYYCAWEENEKLYILTELCSGTLAHARRSYGPLPEDMLRNILRQVGEGLAHLHSKWQIAHLDVKPENLYTTGNGIYKLGDLGLACLGDRRDNAEEGDKRYLSWEMLQRSDCDLYKVDIFALGVSMYELASSHPLPSNGDAYHALRNGAVPSLEKVTFQFQSLIFALMLPEPSSRPNAQELCKHPLLHEETFPCLQQDASFNDDVNILPILSDPTLLEWTKERAHRLEKEAEVLNEELNFLAADAKRWEAVARKRRALA